jgi:hypothetical protein
LNSNDAGRDVITKTVSLEDWDELPAIQEEIEDAKAEEINKMLCGR